jgi:hypothetical protein
MFAGAGLTDTLTSPAVVYCLFALHTGDWVRARQSLCGAVTEFGPERDVLVPPPLTPDHLSPATGAKDVLQQPTLSWRDPGAQEERHATSFYAEILQGSQVVRKFDPPAAPGGVTTYPLPAPPLTADTAYTWRIRGVNSTTSSEFASAIFTTAPPPAPPPPPPPTQHYSVLLKWKPGTPMYVQSDPVYASATSRVLKVGNKNPWGHRCSLLFPNKYVLNDGAEATPAQLGLTDVMLGMVITATPGNPLDGQQGQWDVWVELTYTT